MRSRSSTGITPSSTRSIAASLLGEDSPWLPVWQQRCEQLLAAGNPDALIAQVNACRSEIEGRRDKLAAKGAIDDLVRYYTNNAERMEYAYYRTRGYPIGTGAVESAHRHVLQTRMKRAGQRWALRCARRMARLRAAYRTGGATHFYDGIRSAHRDSHLPRLVESLDASVDPGAEEAWTAEIQRRLARIEAGEAKSISMSEAVARLHRAAHDR